MEIINKKIDEITPYENNPRKNDEAVKYVKKSIEEFGFKVPIIIDKNNEIVCGHTRLKAAKELDLKEVPCIKADDLTEEQIKAFRVADNKVGEMSNWDFSKLDEELEKINIDMEMFGFEKMEDIDIDAFFEEVDSDQQQDQQEEEQKQTVVCPHCGKEFKV